MMNAVTTIRSAINSLRAEQRKIERAIGELQGLLHSGAGRTISAKPVVRKRARQKWTAAAKEAARARMKAYWAKRKKEAM